MKCEKCFNDYEEKEIQLSHDIPKYIDGKDIDGRHWLCEKCHKEYDKKVLKKILEYAGEKLNCDEEISIWQRELKKQTEELKKEFRIISKEVCNEFFIGVTK